MMDTAFKQPQASDCVLPMTAVCMVIPYLGTISSSSNDSPSEIMSIEWS